MEKLKKLNPMYPGSMGDEQIDWSKQGAEEMRQKVKTLASRKYGDQNPPRILFMGETGSGKSSFISSIVSALARHIIYTTTIGESQGREENTSKRYLEHPAFFDEEDEPLNFILCDSRGIAKKNQLGVADREILRLIDGKMRHNDLIESERSGDGQPIDTRPSMPPSCVVFVQKAQRLGLLDEDVQQKLHKAMDIVRARGIPSCVVVTHIDLVKPSLTKDLRYALHSRKVQERVTAAAKDAGVNPNRVFVVKNYTEERRTHTYHDILILRALCGILVDVYRRQRETGARHSLTRNRSLPSSMYHVPSAQSLPLQVYKEGHSVPHSHVSSIGSGPNTSISRQQPVLPPHVMEEATPYQHSRFLHERFYSEPVQFVHTPPANHARNTSLTDLRTGVRRLDSETEREAAEHRSGEYWADDGATAIYRPIVNPPYSTALQNAFDRLAHNPFPESYKAVCTMRGARPLFTPIVRQMTIAVDSASARDNSFSLQQQLPKTFSGEDDLHRHLQETLEKLSIRESDRGSLWMSYTLSVDFSLPLMGLPPLSVDIQAFCLIPGQPAFVLTVISPEKVLEGEDNRPQEQAQRLVEEDIRQVKSYTLQIIKLLRKALLNYCCCDFVLLPCIVRRTDLTLFMLKKELKAQKEASRMAYDGPWELSPDSYKQLKEAATVVTGGTRLPDLMHSWYTNQNVEKEPQLVLMDPDWRGVVSLLTEALTGSENQTIIYPNLANVKVMVAVLEATKRLSFVEDVLILTDNIPLWKGCQELKERMLKDSGVTLKLSVLPPSNQTTAAHQRNENYIILFDCPPWLHIHTDAVILRISDAAFNGREWV